MVAAQPAQWSLLQRSLPAPVSLSPGILLSATPSPAIANLTVFHPTARHEALSREVR
jgi:hypothetical protein